MPLSRNFGAGPIGLNILLQLITVSTFFLNGCFCSKLPPKPVGAANTQAYAVVDVPQANEQAEYESDHWLAWSDDQHLLVTAASGSSPKFKFLLLW